MTVLVVVLFSTVANVAAAAVISWHYRHRRACNLDIRPLSEDARRRFSADRERLAGEDVVMRVGTDTETLRLARIHYRALVTDLLGEAGAAPRKPAAPDAAQTADS